jgi:hypothetical protein
LPPPPAVIFLHAVLFHFSEDAGADDGGTVNNLGANNPLSVASATVTNFYATSATQWYSK